MKSSDIIIKWNRRLGEDIPRVCKGMIEELDSNFISKSQHQKELKNRQMQIKLVWEENQKLKKDLFIKEEIIRVINEQNDDNKDEIIKLKKELLDVKKDLKLAKQCNNFMKRFDCLNKDCKNYVCVLNNNKKLKGK